jgi:hypothetical protein
MCDMRPMSQSATKTAPIKYRMLPKVVSPILLYQSFVATIATLLSTISIYPHRAHANQTAHELICTAVGYLVGSL